jgi:hypothetical protein
MTDYFDSRYLALVGHVQSGKTIEEINYCYTSVTKYKRPVVFIVRNITADQLQLRARFLEHTKIKVELLTHLTTKQAIAFMENAGVIILLCNSHQLFKMKRIIQMFSGNYHVCIDEVDFSIKSRNLLSNIDINLKFIKQNASHILGATATPCALFFTDKTLSKVKAITPNKRYHGIESLTVNFVDSCIIRSESDFPLCDMGAMDNIYDDFMGRLRGFILHTVVKEKENHYKIQEYLANIYPGLTVIVYNGDGIKVYHQCNYDLADRKTLNKFNQLVCKYYRVDNYHYFHKWAISDVLQILLDDPNHSHTHISIVAGHLAARGISFVSSDYKLHLTDQYFYAARNTHGENLLQSLRILGCYSDDVPLRLWCSERTWDAIVAQNKVIRNIVEGIHDSKNWMADLTNIHITTRPKNPLTRPKLCNYQIQQNENIFKLDVFYPPEEETLEEDP